MIAPCEAKRALRVAIAATEAEHQPIIDELNSSQLDGRL